MKEEKIELKDGRILSYCMYGPDNGKPVLYFHGTPSSCREPELLKAYDIEPGELLQDAGVRIIAIDRPGMGHSSFHKGGNYQSFSQDVNELMDALEISSAPVFCWSGGGIYALTMAFYLPHRTEALYIICGISKRFDAEVVQAMGFNKWYFLMAKKCPGTLKLILNILRRKRLNTFLPQKFTGLSFVDYALLNDPQHLSKVSRVTLQQACMNGSSGAVQEAANYFKDPDINLENIDVPVHYWWGTKDMSVVIHHAQEVERKVPGSKMYYREGEGHFSLYINSWAEVIQMISSEVEVKNSKVNSGS
jgi:pimeloyl-ACP methyl ester carboxylesterase